MLGLPQLNVIVLHQSAVKNYASMSLSHKMTYFTINVELMIFKLILEKVQ